MITPQEWSYGYDDLARCTGLTRNAVVKHRSRGHVDPESLESVAVYLARYGRDDLKRAMLDAIAWRQLPKDPGGWKAAKKRKGKGKKELP